MLPLTEPGQHAGAGVDHRRNGFRRRRGDPGRQSHDGHAGSARLRRGRCGDGAEHHGRAGFSRNSSRCRGGPGPVVVGDIGVGAAKTGMLASSTIIEAVASVCREVGIGRAGSVPLVVDPVCASMHGDALLHADALDTLRERLIPLATIVTPNLDEVRLLTGINVVDDRSARRAAEALHGLGAHWVVIKGGHLRDAVDSIDLLYDGDRFLEFAAERIPTGNDHGGGDTLAAALACALAHGYSVPDAMAFGKQWVTRCLAAGYDLGAGHGPVSPLWRLWESPPA